MDLPDRFGTGVALLWASVAVVVVLFTFGLTAHRDLVETGESTRTTVAATATTEPSRPGGVPADAVLVRGTTVLGAAPPGAPRLFYWLTCDGRLLTITTTGETIYAEVDCGRYWLVHEVVRPYQGQPVRIEIGVGTGATLVMEAESAGPARFDVAAVWVQSR